MSTPPYVSLYFPLHFIFNCVMQTIIILSGSLQLRAKEFIIYYNINKL